MFRDFRKVEDPRVNYHSYGNHHLQQVQHGTTINGPVSIATLDYVRVSKADNDQFPAHGELEFPEGDPIGLRLDLPISNHHVHVL